MIEFARLKQEKGILKAIDCELTPQEAFEAYQIKSPKGWTYRSLPEVYYFVIQVFKQEADVLLVKRTLKDSEEICLIPAPESLVSDCVARQGGDQPPHGQYAIDEPIKEWLQAQLKI